MVEIYIEKEDCNIVSEIESRLTELKEINICVDKNGKLVGVRLIEETRKRCEEEFSIEDGNRVYYDNLMCYE